MALQFTSLNSGSNGNCYYIGNDTDAVLIDAGLSCRETEKRMKLLGLKMEKIRAIFISHEHGDHIKGVQGLCAKHLLPLYITNETYKKSRLQVSGSQLRWLITGETISINGIDINSFSKLHDACDPHSFTISSMGVTVGVFTDIGAACKNVTHHFGKCHAAFLEANYDEAMLENGFYPYHLKNRIRGGLGHLSNTQALEIFKSHGASFMSHLLLSHLSKDNNDPKLAQELFQKNTKHAKIIVASRYEATELFTIKVKGIKSETNSKQILIPRQISLFD